jgi:hypothetical protein
LKAGREVDFKLFKEELSGLKYKGRAVWVDLGFLGIRHWLSDARIFIPHKKSRGKALSEAQRKENAAMARVRVKIYERTQHLNHHDLQQATLERFFDKYFPIAE